jgi:hypothetical protein
MKLSPKTIEKIFNTIGNEYLVSNFETEPFEFKVNIRRDRNHELYDYIVEINSTPAIPETLKYRPEIGKRSDGAHISVLRNEFKNFIRYVDSSFGGFGNILGVEFMNVDKGKK